MDEIEQLIATATEARAALKEKHGAFGEIVRRYQDLAYGYAYAILGDFQMAEDAAQDAFIAAWRNLDQLRRPEAFTGWFKRIILSQCSRLTRGKQLELVPLEAAYSVPCAGADPQQAVERKESREQVLAAIQSLPENERVVTTLFHISEYSLNEIAAFLEVPLTTVKKRLWSARQKLREKMLDVVKHTLQEQRPSRDERFARTVAAYNQALESLVDKLQQDRYVLAAILFGSLSYDQVWEKSDIDLMIIGTEEKKPRYGPGGAGTREVSLVESGINVHATVMARSTFRALIEGSLNGSFNHSAFSRSTLLFSRDESLKDLYEGVHRVGERDKELQLLKVAGGVTETLAKAEKWFHVKRDMAYSFLWIMYCVNSLAIIEVLLHNEVHSREAIHQALRHNPRFFNQVYTDLIYGPKDEAQVEAALRAINDYLEERLQRLFGLILQFLSDEGGVRSTTDLDAYFSPRVQGGSMACAYEWLADKGVIQKVSSPLRLHEKSRVVMDEAAYYYDGGNHK